MENKDSVGSLRPKQAPVFNSIDEYESYINDNIKDSLSVFMNSMKDFDIFRKMFSANEARKEVNISHNLEELLEELKESSIALTQVTKNVKQFSEEKTTQRPKRKRVHYYFCKENGTNLAVTEILNPFEQREIPDELMQTRFFLKKTEVKCINELICLKIRNILQKKFRIAFEEGVENERWTKDGIEIQNTEKDKLEQKLYNTIMRRKIVNNAVKRLYPKPSVREGINDQFYVDKINEYNYNGKYLTKKVNFQTLFKEFKIQPKEDFKGDPLNDLKLADDIIKEYNNEKARDKNNSKNNGSKKEEESFFKRGDLLFDKKDLLITKSKMYIKVDRKDKNRDFKLLGEPLNDKSKFFD
jgi:hypothetical protein